MMLEMILAEGNRGHSGYSDTNQITCADGFSVSVIAGGGTYCAPRPAFCSCAMLSDYPIPTPLTGEVEHDYPGPYTEAEVGFPSERPEPWDEWKVYVEDEEKPTETVYSYVPVRMVRDLIASHGGER